MRGALLVLSALTALGGLIVPCVGSADMLCQNRKSKKIYRMDACTGKKMKVVYDFGQITQVQAQVESLQDAVVGSSASSFQSRLEALESKLPLGVEDLAFSLIVPYPANAIGNHWRVLSAHLDMSDADDDGVSVESQSGPWLSLSSFDASDVSADFTIAADAFEGLPQCVASVEASSSPDAPAGLEVSVAAGGISPAQVVHVRVVGANRSFDVHGTLLCLGVAKL